MEAQARVVPQSEGSDVDVDSDVDSVNSDVDSSCATTMLSDGRPSNSAQLESAAMRVTVLPLSTSTDGAGVYSSQAAPSSLSQLPRPGVELTTFEICMLPECGR